METREQSETRPRGHTERHIKERGLSRGKCRGAVKLLAVPGLGKEGEKKEKMGKDRERHAAYSTQCAALQWGLGRQTAG